MPSELRMPEAYILPFAEASFRAPRAQGVSALRNLTEALVEATASERRRASLAMARERRLSVAQFQKRKMS